MSVLGLCSILSCPVRPAAVLNVSSAIIPATVTLLERLIEAYKGRVDLYCVCVAMVDNKSIKRVSLGGVI